MPSGRAEREGKTRILISALQVFEFEQEILTTAVHSSCITHPGLVQSRANFSMHSPVAMGFGQ